MKPTYKKIIIVVLLLAALGGGYYWYQLRHPVQYKQGLYPFSPQLAGKTVIQNDYIRYPGKNGQNAVDLLKAAIGTTPLTVPDKDHVWNLYLNAQKQTDPPDKVMTKTGDIVEWVQQSTKEEVKF